MNATPSLNAAAGDKSGGEGVVWDKGDRLSAVWRFDCCACRHVPLTILAMIPARVMDMMVSESCR